MKLGGEYLDQINAAFGCIDCRAHATEGGPIPANMRPCFRLADVSTWNLAALSSISGVTN